MGRNEEKDGEGRPGLLRVLRVWRGRRASGGNATEGRRQTDTEYRKWQEPPGHPLINSLYYGESAESLEKGEKRQVRPGLWEGSQQGVVRPFSNRKTGCIPNSSALG